jgi:CHAD domain-containing protein
MRDNREAMEDAGTAEFAARQVALLLERLLFEMHRSARQPDPDPVHDLRVSIRRFNQGCRLFRKFLPAPEIRKIRKKLKSVMTMAGNVRDRDIALELAAKAGLEERLEAVPRLRTERQIAAEALVEELKIHTRHVHLMRWRAVVRPVQSASGKRRPPASFAARRLPGLAGDFFSAGRTLLAADVTNALLHQLRLRGKRLRYSLELFRALYGPVLEDRLAAMRKLQNSLGEVNDCHSTRVLLDADPDTATKAEFLAWLNRRETRRARDFRKLWAESFDAPGEEARWQAYLTRYAGRAGARA